MNSSIWLRIAAVLQALGTIAHTVATTNPPSRGPTEVAVFEAMRNYHFDIVGFSRSHWDFHRGYELSITVVFAMIAVLIWQLSIVSCTAPQNARPLIVTILVAQVFLSVLSWVYFFAGPGVVSLLVIALLIAALTSLPRTAVS